MNKRIELHEALDLMLEGRVVGPEGLHFCWRCDDLWESTPSCEHYEVVQRAVADIRRIDAEWNGALTAAATEPAPFLHNVDPDGDWNSPEDAAYDNR